MLKIMIVKTWCENTQEGINYLKYNGYGKTVKRIPFTDLFVCIGYKNFKKLNDVIIVSDKKEMKKEKMIGYDIFDFDGTGMLEIQKVDEDNIFNSDDEAVEQAIKDGIKIIPVNELPKNFDRKYLGWIDTEENRKAIENYCR